MTRFRAVFAVTSVALVLTACGGGDSVSVEDAWGRPSPMEASNAAFYMQITGGGDDDTVVSASSEVCSVTELHETMMDDGVMSMEERPDGFPIPAGETVSLEPGGLHVMCIGADTLEVGDEVTVDLEFVEAGTVSVVAEIRESG